MKPRYRQGFTLLEILIVVAVLAVLAAIGLNTLSRFRESQKLREAQVQFSQTIERARSLSRRYSRYYWIEVKPPVVSPAKNFSYRISPRSFSRDYVNGSTSYPEVPDSDTNKPPVVDLTLPAGISLYDVSGNKALDSTQTIRIAGPFGRLDSASSSSFCLMIAGSSKASAEVQILGVTAKVVNRGIKYGNTPCR